MSDCVSKNGCFRNSARGNNVREEMLILTSFRLQFSLSPVISCSYSSPCEHMWIATTNLRKTRTKKRNLSETWIMMNWRKDKFKVILLTVFRCLVVAEELKKFLFTVAEKGRHYVSEMGCFWPWYFDGIAENQANQKPVSWCSAVPPALSLPSHYFLYQLLKCLKRMSDLDSSHLVIITYHRFQQINYRILNW